ncbi:MAG: response regulator transcription factor [Holdemanella porci]
MKHILIVDDDIHINDMLDTILSQSGYKVSHAYSGTEALLFLSTCTSDLILLDLMLPGLSGEKVLSKINEIPVIVMSAKVDVKNKVDLLLNGTVDYITKPFDIDELLARILVQFRKKEGNKKILNYGDISIDRFNRFVQIHSQNLKLTKTEYAILKLLMENPNQVITKTILLERISEDTPDCMESSLRVHISHLRKKLKDVSGKDYIESVWGIGFKMKEI